MSETTNVRRYRIDGSHGEYGRWTYHGMERDEAGSWVPYDDHADALAAARREVETWQRKAGEQEMRAILAEREANEHSAALEDVRRVESFWSGDINRVHCEWEDEEGARPLFTAYNGCDIVASADSLEALGRALAQEAGDAK